MSVEEFTNGLKGEVVGEVKEVDGLWVWTCDCGVSGDCDFETLATMTLYFHRRSGHRPVHDVQVVAE